MSQHATPQHAEASGNTAAIVIVIVVNVLIIAGRASDHPDNMSGIAMPARGGNPSLGDNDLLNVIHYVRSLNPDTVVYDVRPDGAAPIQPVVEAVAATPTVFQTVAAVEFKPIDLGALGGSSPTATPAP